MSLMRMFGDKARGPDQHFPNTDDEDFQVTNPHEGMPHPAELHDQEQQQHTGRAVSKYEPAPASAVTKTNETSAAVLSARVRAEIEARTMVAIGRPRNIDLFRQKILNACRRTRFADAAMYEKPVGGGKNATGLSIRFAEECARHYGNLMNQSLIVSESDEERTVRVTAVDLETNTSFDLDVLVKKTVERKSPRPGDEVLRVRTNSKNQPVSVIRADEDALLTKQSALTAKAQREVILKHIPSDIKEEAIEIIDETLRSGVEKDPEGEKKKILDAFFAIGVTPEQVGEFLGHALTTVNPAELFLLKRVYRGIRDEGHTWADVMESHRGQTVPEKTDAPAAGEKGGAAKLRAAVAPKKKETDARAAFDQKEHVPGCNPTACHPDCPKFADKD